ncbi:phenoloxidase-activating factor 2-like [Sabethes cyaneus]|uniref:phenoloxidase-activating factor 2-like n=1 Tax=Sabethes cyaneus TaxID=53552 RepID=UPI00237EBD8B|nr:phenoloxidase-activating factor 2-like [Sabethes cyaneus]
MGWKVSLLVIIINSIVLGTSQQGGNFYFGERKTTTQDPVHIFFGQPEPGGGEVYFPSTRPSIRVTPTVPTTTIPTTTTGIFSVTTTTEEPVDDDYVPPDCGTQQSELDIDEQDNKNANRNQFPWNVGIFTTGKNYFGTDQQIFHCGGTVIDEFVILTAAFCVRGKIAKNLLVIAGMWDINDVQDKRQVRKVRQIISHPKYVPTSTLNNIALLFLDDKLDYAPNVNRICLPDQRVDFNESNCFATGWGDKSIGNSAEQIRPIMKVLQQELVEHERCAKQIGGANPNFQLSRVFQCAVGDRGDALCKYDTGSPLMCKVPGREKQFYQVGIFSYTPVECSAWKGPNVFIKVSYFRQWIDHHLEANQRNAYIYTPASGHEDDENTENGK